MAQQQTMAKERANFEVLKQLRELIRREYREGGTLPNQTIMCERLGVSNKTYLKAVRYLVVDGTASTGKGKAGTRITPEYARAKKIGLAVLDGGESPFLQNGRILGALIGRLEEYGYCTQILQSSSPDKIALKALQHGVRAVVWFNPAESALPAMRRLAREHPLLAMMHEVTPVLQQAMDAGLPVISAQREQIGELLPRILRQHNTRRLVFVAYRAGQEIADALPLFSRKGIAFREECCLSHHEMPQRLQEVIDRTAADAIYVKGGGAIYRTLLELLDRLPRARRPLVFADFAQNYQPDPQVESSITGYFQMVLEPIGSTAADALRRSLEDAVPLHSILLPVLQYVPADNILPRPLPRKGNR